MSDDKPHRREPETMEVKDWRHLVIDCAIALGKSEEGGVFYLEMPDRIRALAAELAEARQDTERLVERCLDRAYQKLTAENRLRWFPRRDWRELRSAALDAAKGEG